MLAVLAGVTSTDLLGLRTPSLAQLQVNAGLCDRATGRITAATEWFGRALGSTPEDGVAWLHLALAHERSGDPVLVMKTFRSAERFIAADESLILTAQAFLERHRDLAKATLSP